MSYSHLYRRLLRPFECLHQAIAFLRVVERQARLGAVRRGVAEHCCPELSFEVITLYFIPDASYHETLSYHVMNPEYASIQQVILTYDSS